VQVVSHCGALELDATEQPEGASLVLLPGEILANMVDRNRASRGSFACHFVWISSSDQELDYKTENDLKEREKVHG